MVLSWTRVRMADWTGRIEKPYTRRVHRDPCQLQGFGRVRVQPKPAGELQAPEPEPIFRRPPPSGQGVGWKSVQITAVSANRCEFASSKPVFACARIGCRHRPAAGALSRTARARTLRRLA